MAPNPNRCSGYPDLCPPLPCADGPMRTPLDPSSNSTFDSVQSVFSEVALLLPEVLLHTGQDEVHTGCGSLPESENCNDLVRLTLAAGATRRTLASARGSGRWALARLMMRTRINVLSRIEKL